MCSVFWILILLDKLCLISVFRLRFCDFVSLFFCFQFWFCMWIVLFRFSFSSTFYMSRLSDCDSCFPGFWFSELNFNFAFYLLKCDIKEEDLNVSVNRTFFEKKNITTFVSLCSLYYWLCLLTCSASTFLFICACVCDIYVFCLLNFNFAWQVVSYLSFSSSLLWFCFPVLLFSILILYVNCSFSIFFFFNFLYVSTFWLWFLFPWFLIFWAQF